MLFIQLFLIFFAIFFIVKTFVRYDPKFDLVRTSHSYKLLLWYHKYDWFGNKYRAYIKIFEI